MSIWIGVNLDTSHFVVYHILIMMFIANTTCSQIRVIWIQVTELSKETTCFPYSNLQCSMITWYESCSRISGMLLSFQGIFADSFSDSLPYYGMLFYRRAYLSSQVIFISILEHFDFILLT